MKKGKTSPVSGFASRLKLLREQKGLSQAELAGLAGIHHMHVSRYERGLSRPSADSLQKLASALDVTGDYLIEGGTQDLATSEIEDRELLGLFLQIAHFTDEDKMAVKKVLSAMVNQQRLQEMAANMPGKAVASK